MAFTKILGPGIHTEADLEVDDINAGIVTAETFIGDASQLTGLPSGLGTALSNDVDSPLNKIYYTDSVLSVGATITIDHPSSAVAAYTQYADIVATGDADIIVEDGDDFVPDILGLSTSGPPGVLAGGGGRIRADNISSKSGLGAVSFTNGVNVGGITTVAELHVGIDTGFFTEDLVVNGSARITGIFTVGRDTLIFDGANNSITVGSGVTIDGSSGIITATNFSGNLQGNAQGIQDNAGNVVAQANASGLMLTGITTVTSGKLMVGNAYVDATAVGVGSTDTAGRNAGVGTMPGSLIYNITNGAIETYAGDTDGWMTVKRLVADQGIQATGGEISEYTAGGAEYRAHIFTTSGSFDITSIGTYGETVDVLVVAGGGGGGGDLGGGGGAGGFRSESGVTVGANPYSVIVGAGGVGGAYGVTRDSPLTMGGDGNNSLFSTVNATGGGGGGIFGGLSSPNKDGRTGGSGGGAGGANAGTRDGTGGAGNTPATMPAQGFPGGSTTVGAPGYGSGGGGGASGAGTDGTDTIAGPGGDGLANNYAYGPTNPVTYAGGGGAGFYNNGTATTRPSGGAGGGGGGGTGTNTAIDYGPTGASGQPGEVNTGGGGGGGSWCGTVGNLGGHGGSGIVVIRYRIGFNEAGIAKATGGAINFVAGKTIHTFNNSGTFAISDSSLTSVEYLVVGGGGGGGGGWQAGGGGAGALRYATGLSVNTSPGSYTVTVGAGGDSGVYNPGLGASPGTKGSLGGDSSIANPTMTTVTSAGGGGGGSYWAAPGLGGGSGGGGGTQPSTGTPGTGSGDPGGTDDSVSPSNGWGNDGGAGGSPYASPYAGGGGGGAGAVGFAGGTGIGNGGAGLSYSISGIATHYAGGGGGGAYQSTASTGGIGGGGAGGRSTPALNTTPGTQNTGGGGGGGGGSGPMATPGTPHECSIGGQGGSGVVIIAYPT